MWRRNLWKRLLMYFVVLALASFSVWAFPGRAPKQDEPIVTESIPTTSTVSQTTEVKTESKISSEPSTSLEESKKLVEDLEEVIPTVDDHKIQELLEIVVEETKNGIECEKDAMYLSARNAEVEGLNAQQADEIARLEAIIKEEKGVHPYLKIGTDIGFNNNLSNYGVTTSLGLKFNSGFMIEAGAGYKIGSFLGGVYPWSMDNLTIDASIGWMW